MLFPYTRAWTRTQKALIVGAAVLAVASSAAVIYGYERYYRGPDDSIFVGTWRGTIDYNIDEIVGTYRFRRDHTFERGSEPAGKWQGGGEFLYLRERVDDASEPYDRLQIWRVDSITESELRMRSTDGVRAHLKRVE